MRIEGCNYSVSGRFMRALNSESTNDESENKESTVITNPIAHVAVFANGDLVEVESRTWPGINKPGGVGRIKQYNPEG